ncbi:MAG: hypothetical protein ACRD3O_00695 [Terriglobia bacterium]
MAKPSIDGWTSYTDDEVKDIEDCGGAPDGPTFGWITRAGNNFFVDGLYITFSCTRHCLRGRGNGVGMAFELLGGLAWAKSISPRHIVSSGDAPWYERGVQHRAPRE